MAKKKIHSLFWRKKNGGEFKRGALLCVLIIIIVIFFFQKGPVVFAFVFAATLLYENGNVALVFTGKNETGLSEDGGSFSGSFVFCYFLPSPLEFGKRLLWTGVTYWNLGIPALSGTRWNTETCCSTKKKISMALNCLNISKSNMAWGEKPQKRGIFPHSAFSSWGGIWEYETNQDNKLFSVFIDILPLCSTFINLQF